MELDSMTKGKLSNKEMPDIRTIYKAFDFATSFALKSTMTMGIPHILARSKEPMTADNIVEKLPCKNPAAAAGYLDRIMDILIVPGFYSKTPVSNADGKSHKAAYGLTPVSRMLVKDDVQFTLLPIALLHVHRVFTDSFQHLHKSVLEDRAPMEVALGKPFYEYLAENQDVRSTFQEALSCHLNYWIKILAQEYDGLEHTKTLVDVGGCEGESLKELVAVHPHIHGINFDMPVVIQNAPQIPGVDHVGGDYFASVPAGDTIFLKMVLHNNGDEECLKILKNCYQALPERGGKVIIVESVYDHDSKEDEAQFVKYLDVMMLSVFLNGRERSFDAYKALLTSCGFGDCKLIKLSGGVTLIEAYKY